MPPAYTSQQKSAISDFTSYTQADKATAAKILKVHNWHVNSAVNA
jgi:DCN1-like protein 1/2